MYAVCSSSNRFVRSSITGKMRKVISKVLYSKIVIPTNLTSFLSASTGGARFQFLLGAVTTVVAFVRVGFIDCILLWFFGAVQRKLLATQASEVK